MTCFQIIVFENPWSCFRNSWSGICAAAGFCLLRIYKAQLDALIVIAEALAEQGNAAVIFLSVLFAAVKSKGDVLMMFEMQIVKGGFADG